MGIASKPPAPGRFAASIIDWQRTHGRHDLPWQRSRDPYRIWLSEIMLQQTQVSAVIPYYERFLARFPDVRSLAAAREEEVLRLWSGLGYYARARNLHRAARQIAGARAGAFPATAQELEQLPGIGRSTAAAVAALAFGERAAILDGNVKRVLARSFGVRGWPGTPQVQAQLWGLAERLLPARGIQAYTQGLMDLGATLCTRAKPRCGECPVAEACAARQAGEPERFPSPRPRREAPTRAATWLVVRHRGVLALESRPPAGLWGGLWTFPELGGDTLEAYCRARFGTAAASVRKLPRIEHAFTHFRLSVRPILCELPHDAPRRRQRGLRWLTLETAVQGPVPAPVRRLLRELS
jgi:A/G-specific adenine glycosylase